MERSKRITEGRLTPRRLAIARLLSPSWRSCFISPTSLPAVMGRPCGFPSFLAWSIPAFTRSRKISRSNSANTASIPASARPIAVHRLQTAAGSGALDLDEAVKSYAYFRHEWLSRQGLVADRCSIIGVMGESMEPTLPEGCVILLDRNRRKRREGRIFVVRTEEGLVVKRAGKGTGGGWQLVSDHPRWPDAPWPSDAAIIGEVKWMAREL